MKESGCVEPAGKLLGLAGGCHMLSRILQGKSLPSACNGELLRESSP